jgi:glycerol-3-phosphate dehydrogenase
VGYKKEMKRDLTTLTNTVYDLVIIGGGIYGAWVACDAALRGLSVALVEKADFSSATSANSMKIIHGGFRYLQHGDFTRMRESIVERSTLMRMAPHLVHPLPVVIPIYGHGIHGRQMFSLALMVNDLVSFDRNRSNDPQKHIPRGRVISKSKCLDVLPHIQQHGLTGAAVFHDAQVYNSERLVISILRSAEKAGAHLTNYVEVTGFLRDGESVTGVEVKDALTGDRFDIRARIVVNTSGPSMNHVLGLLHGKSYLLGIRFAKAINLITRQLFPAHAVGIAGQNGYRDAGAIVNKGNRLLFITPWRDRSISGTWYSVTTQGMDDRKVAEKDIRDLLDEINYACPAIKLKGEDVTFVHAGLVPLSESDTGDGYVSLAKHYYIHDHRRDGISGLISVLGVKYTTARSVAERVVDWVFEIRGQKPPGSLTAVTPIYGGQINRCDSFLDAALAKAPSSGADATFRRLVYNYGSAYPNVLRYLNPEINPDGAAADEGALLAGHPGSNVLNTCANIMSAELGWTGSRVQQELEEVNDVYA